MNKKLFVFLPLIFSVCSCQITKFKLSDSFVHESSERDEVFSHEIESYSDYEKMNKDKKSYLMYVYADPNCMCYLELKRISLDTVVNNDLLVYTMSVSLMRNKNTYGYDNSNHDYPSIVIAENGRVKYQIHYDDVAYFESTAKFEEYIFNRIELN